MEDEALQPAGLTYDEVSEIVEGAASTVRDVDQSGFDRVAQDLEDIGAAVHNLYQEEGQADEVEEVVYMVRLEPEQAGVLRSAVQVACTEGLLVVVLLALMCGLQAWRVLSGGWRHG